MGTKRNDYGFPDCSDTILNQITILWMPKEGAKINILTYRLRMSDIIMWLKLYAL